MHSHFEKALAYHAAPTLLNRKCGSLVSLSVQEYDINAHTARFQQEMLHSDLRIRVIERHKTRKLLFVYRGKLLSERLAYPSVRQFLLAFGYQADWSAEICLDLLCQRLIQQDFPHEIGIFLDYPLEDVKGFIQNCGMNCKYCGYWKVYGDVTHAKQLFECYRQCRVTLCQQLHQGMNICACVA